MTSPNQPLVAASVAAIEHKDINLVDLLIALGHEKAIWLATTLAAAFIGVAVSLLTTSVYTATSTLMPAQHSGGASGALATLGNLAGLSGLAGASLGAKGSDEMYIAFMRSQSVQAALIEELKLKERYKARTLEDARQSLSAQVSIAADKKSGLIVVAATDPEPEFSARLANAQVEQLNRLMSRLAVTEAQQRRMFYEGQIQKTQKHLGDLEVRYRVAQQSSGVRMASTVAETDLQASVSLRTQIATKEVQLQSLSQFATQKNPEVLRLAGELAAMRAQLERYEQGSGAAKSPATHQQEAVQLFRELKTQEAMLDAFVRQLEVARIDEAKDGPGIQVVDIARVPEVRSKPERKKSVLAYTVTGALLGLLLAVLRALMRYANSTPGGAKQWRQLQHAWLRMRRPAA